jgi:hypothetical protein
MTKITQRKWNALPLDVRNRFLGTDIPLPDSVWGRVLDGAVSLSALVDNMLEVRTHYTAERAVLLDIRAECLDMLNKLIDSLDSLHEVERTLAEIGENPYRAGVLAHHAEALGINGVAQMREVIERVGANLPVVDHVIHNVDATLALWSDHGPVAP